MADQRPFAGIKVLDLTRVLAGPFCAYQLGLLGAEVIKIERPGRGETVRWRTEADPSFGRQGMSLGFMTQSANKRFLTLDIDQPVGREIFLKLAADAEFPGATEVVRIDGLRVEYPDGFGLARGSNTTPVVVLRFEADDAAALERIKGEFRRVLVAAKPGIALPF